MAKAKIFISLMLVVMVSFMAVGYAEVVDTLLISGTATIQLEGLYITDVKVTGTTGGEGTYEYYQTNFGSKIPAGTSSVTYQVTITNYGPTSQVYSKVEWGIKTTTDENGNEVQTIIPVDGYNNELLGIVNEDGTTTGSVKISVAQPQVVDANNNTADSRVVDVGEKIILTVTYTNGNKDTDGNILAADTYVNFFFGTSVESAGTAATQGVFGAFEDILNNPDTFADLTEELGYAGTIESWERLLTWLGVKTRDYIGNVADSFSSNILAGREKELVNSLFTDSKTGENLLTLQLYDENGNEVEQEVLVIIQYKDVTGDGVKDMILYMTPEHIYGQGITTQIEIENIYGAVFTSTTVTVINNDGTEGTSTTWAQIGDMYTGTALAGRLNQGGDLDHPLGGLVKLDADSFDPDTWKDIGETITLTDTYSYTVSEGTTMPALASTLAADAILIKKTGATTTDEVNALTELNALHTKAGEILADSKLTGTAVDQLREGYTNATEALTDGKGKGEGYALTFLEAVTCIKELEYALKAFK